ncbi:LysR family transcriptional regulator [Paracoccus sediminis]|uniref:HTH-type transcriptional regulator CbbR n=1 Tax=Paracoccus sediminis TaxID=1214787 RepID=A0A238VJC7_9RHOB|nr:LysR family transcriptional regulator [Paracoccus sediminis]TBN52175.1 LysR family transcriptional regulator [Paracoccus sediminis]SNR34274.1 DNA-binding transcriptional regulator, LysR family [Paracoccus sediminis]
MKLDGLTLRQLRCLRAVADSGSLTNAAAQLRLTTPAIHSQLRGLEDLAGCPLVARAEHGVFRPTPEGHALLLAESQIATALARAGREIGALQQGHIGNVVLGVVSTGKYFAPGLVARLLRRLPDIEVTLRIGNRDAILAALAGDDLDLAIMGRPPREPAVIADPVGPHPHLIIAAPDHPLAEADPVMPGDLLAQTFLSREEGSGTRILMTRFLDRIGEGATWRAVEMGTNETIKQAVIAGLGIALISQHTVTEELRSGRLIALRGIGLPIQRSWYLLRRADRQPSPATARIREEILAMRGGFLPRL